MRQAKNKTENIDLAEPHVHQSVSGLANFSHVQLSSAWCHQAWSHATWVRSVQATQLPDGGQRKTIKKREIVHSGENLQSSLKNAEQCLF